MTNDFYLESFDPVGDFAKIDNLRQARTGFPEVIWGENKTAAQIAQIITKMREYTDVVMATRIEEAKYLEIKTTIPDLQYYPQAKIAALVSAATAKSSSHTITILTAGTADLPVAEEAAVTAELCGFQVQRLWDVGVAGIQRLLSHVRLLERAEVIIVVAGMEGALVSVVAGMVSCPVIAVPTSIGYGANFGGVAALLTALNSCAAGVGTVNIDNGFGAALLAGKILRAKPLRENLDNARDPIEQENSSSGWRSLYAHDADGKKTAGSIYDLLETVRQGRSIKILLEFPEGKEYLVRVEELWINNSKVYGLVNNRLGIEWRDDLMLSRKKDDRLTLIASTQGDLEITRISTAKGKIKGRSYHRVNIKWFAD